MVLGSDIAVDGVRAQVVEITGSGEEALSGKEEAIEANQFVQAAECRNRYRELLEAALRRATESRNATVAE